jgi:hypothetical protein
MASRTRRLVCSEIGRLPVRTYETVLWDTPATRATSLLVYAAIANPLLTRRRYVSSIRISETFAKLYRRVTQTTRPLAQLDLSDYMATEDDPCISAAPCRQPTLPVLATECGRDPDNGWLDADRNLGAAR